MLHHNLQNAFRELATGPKLIVLAYHGIVRNPLSIDDYCFVNERQFQADMQFLNEWGWENLSLVEGANRLQNRSLNGPSFVITFDDGFASVLEFGLPVLRKHNFKATVFLTPKLLQEQKTVWFCDILESLASTKKTHLHWNNKTYDLSSSVAKKHSSSLLQRDLKNLPQDDIFSEIRNIQSALESHPEARHLSPLRLLTPTEISTATSSGLIDFGAHTQNHAILSRTPFWKSEIEESVQAVSLLTQRKCEAFAYPNGTLQDFNNIHSEHLRKIGVSVAVSTVDGTNGWQANPYALRRISVGATQSPFHSPFPDLLSKKKMLYRRLFRSNFVRIPEP
jgi:peptidoglycan/xylan/chitin deacetylase (PgdA/CDA1 family)